MAFIPPRAAPTVIISRGSKIKISLMLGSGHTLRAVDTNRRGRTGPPGSLMSVLAFRDYPNRSYDRGRNQHVGLAADEPFQDTSKSCSSI